MTAAAAAASSSKSKASKKASGGSSQKKKKSTQKDGTPRSTTGSTDNIITHSITPKATATTSNTRVDRSLVKKAVAALIQHHNKQATKSKDILGSDTTVQVQFTLEIAPERAQHKPISVLIPHPIHKIPSNNNTKDDDDDDDNGLEEPEICLLVKEESKPVVQQTIAQFPDQLGMIKKVLGLQSLRTKHAQYNQRRELLHKYTLFLADDRILPMLTSALGRDFLRAKKQPIPIKITGQAALLPLTIIKALSGTHLFLSAGTCLTVRAGTTAMPQSHLVSNILAICGSLDRSDPLPGSRNKTWQDSMGAVRKIPRAWANIRQICIKTPESAALPVYNKTPAELMQVAHMAGLESVWKNNPQMTVVSTTKDQNDDTDQKKQQHMKDGLERKRKLEKVKSPLLRALKKQKQQEQATSKAQENEAVAPEEMEQQQQQSRSESDQATKSVDNRAGAVESSKKKKTNTDDNDAATPASNKKQQSRSESDQATESVDSRAGAVEHASSKKKKEKMNDDKPATPASSKKTTDTKSLKKASQQSHQDTPKSSSKSKTKVPDEETLQSPAKKAKTSDDAVASKSSAKGVKQAVDEPTPSSTKNAKKSDGATPKASATKAKKSDGDETPTTSANRAKKANDEGTPKSPKQSNEAFILSKKFNGSKSGYIFQKGQKGLGYYLDDKPVVDRMALEAFARMPTSKINKSKSPSRRSSSGSRRSSSGSGKRRR